MTLRISRRDAFRLGAGAVGAGLLVRHVSTPVHAQTLPDQITLIVPAGTGGSWEKLARTMQATFQAIEPAARIDVVNRPGAGEVTGLEEVAKLPTGSRPTVLVGGLSLLGAALVQRSPVGLEAVVPVARLSAEVQVAVVASGSPIRSIGELAERFKRDPEALRWGGGAAGSAGHMVIGLLAQRSGVAPLQAKYQAFRTVQEAADGLVKTGAVDILVSSYAEFAASIDAGTMRPLAISSDARLPGLAVPTFRESGFDLELVNWKGVFAPPSMNAAVRARLEAALARMSSTPDWSSRLAERFWLSRFQPAAVFREFIVLETTRISALLRSQGLLT